MTPENQRDEDLKKAREIRKNFSGTTMDGFALACLESQVLEALTAQRQSWEREKAIDAEYRKLMQEALDAIKKENAGLEERVTQLEQELASQTYKGNSIGYIYDKMIAYQTQVFPLSNALKELGFNYPESGRDNMARERTLIEWAHNKAEELTRLKSRNEELEAENERLAKNAEDNQKLCQEKHNLMVSERSKWASQRETIHRLTPTLARAHEALEDVRDANHFDYRDKSENCEKAHYVIALPLGVDRKITKLLLDKDGSLAFEKWKKMEAVVEAGRKWAKKNPNDTELFEALEALDAKGEKNV